MKKRWQSWALNLTIFLVLVYAVEYWQSRRVVRGPLPEFLRTESLAKLQGGTQSLWSPDQFTVVYIFAPWCGVCRASGATIENLPTGFHKAALALSWENEKDVEEFVKASGLKIPVLLGRDREEAALGVDAFPTYLVIDNNGRVVRAWSGYTTTLGLWIKSWLARLI